MLLLVDVFILGWSLGFLDDEFGDAVQIGSGCAEVSSYYCSMSSLGLAVQIQPRWGEASSKMSIAGTVVSVGV